MNPGDDLLTELPPDFDDAALPERLGPYQIVGRLGRGGMGEVFEGFDGRLERPVALKRVHPERVDAKAVERLRREARAVARLNHSAIVQVHDWVDDASGHWIVMERVDGRSLRQVLEQGALPWSEALRLARQVADGLEAAHRAGIVHRDLKAENLMVTADDGVKILDFGLAKQVVRDDELSLTADGKILGTVTAMSPEQALGHAVDARSDLFSLGVLLYEMIAGVSPFRAATPMETLTRICTWRQAPLYEVETQVPRVLSEWVDGLLEKEPGRRPALASLSRDMDALLRDAPASQLMEAHDEDVQGPGSSYSEGAALEAPTAATDSLPETRHHQDADEWGAASDSADRTALTTSLTSTWRRPRSALWALALGITCLLAVLALWWSRPFDPAAPERDTALARPPAAVSLLQQPLEPMDDYRLYQHGMQLLERYDKEGHVDRAIEAFQRLLARQPDSAPGHAGLARAYWEKFENASKDPQWLQQARTVATRGVQLDPFLVEGRVSLGWVLLTDGEPEGAEEEFQRALQLEPDNVDALRGLAERERLEGRLEDAESFYRRALAVAPDDWSLQAYWGSLLYRMGRLDEAVQAFQGCIDAASDSPVCYRNLAGIYFYQGRYAEAADMFQKTLEIRPTAGLYSNLGTLLFYQGLYSQAVEAFEKALELGANDYRLWANLADAYRWAPGYEDKAAETYGRAIQLLEDKLTKAPDDHDGTSRLALYLSKQGHCSEALGALTPLEDAEGSDGTVFFRQATVYEICGRRADALRCLESALSVGYSLEDIKRDPELLELRRDPAYHRLLLRNGSESS